MVKSQDRLQAFRYFFDVVMISGIKISSFVSGGYENRIDMCSVVRDIHMSSVCHSGLS